MEIDPRRWYPFEYGCIHVNHKGCFGYLYNRYDQKLNLLDQACSVCTPCFNPEQLEMFPETKRVWR